MTVILLTFVATTGLYVGLAVLAFCRVMRHLQTHPDGMRAVTEHVLAPLFGRQGDKTGQERPES
jgi:hypothetical protein